MHHICIVVVNRSHRCQSFTSYNKVKLIRYTILRNKERTFNMSRQVENIMLLLCCVEFLKTYIKILVSITYREKHEILCGSCQWKSIIWFIVKYWGIIHTIFLLSYLQLFPSENWMVRKEKGKGNRGY